MSKFILIGELAECYSAGMRRKVAAVITDILGDRVVVMAEAVEHVILRHFTLFPRTMVLELIERVLRDPSEVFEEKKKHIFHLFYRFDSHHYIVVIVKRTTQGSFFVTAYPTGAAHRGKHKNLKKVRL
jgi:hypothetical protein